MLIGHKLCENVFVVGFGGFLVVMEFELTALGFLGRHSTT
jgi:hypothetical protein